MIIVAGDIDGIQPYECNITRKRLNSNNGGSLNVRLNRVQMVNKTGTKSATLEVFGKHYVVERDLVIRP